MAALVLRDSLTGLANRRLFKELLDADLAPARNGLSLAIAFLDLDGLKQVNDTYGHDAGDKVLCETARRLMSLSAVPIRSHASAATSSSSCSSRTTRARRTSCNASTPRWPADRRHADHLGRVPGEHRRRRHAHRRLHAAALLAAADEAMYAVKRARQTAHGMMSTAARRRSEPVDRVMALAGASGLRGVGGDHPGCAEPIDAHPERGGPRRLGDRHVGRASSANAEMRAVPRRHHRPRSSPACLARDRSDRLSGRQIPSAPGRRVSGRRGR